MRIFLLKFFLSVLLVIVSSAHAGDLEAGKSEYVKNCSGCHSTDPVINHYAPNLHCVINRKAGTADFSGYSVDFKKVTADLVWTKDLLFEYLKNQKEFVSEKLNAPEAQIMMNLNFPDPNLRMNIIAYLASLCVE